MKLRDLSGRACSYDALTKIQVYVTGHNPATPVCFLFVLLQL